MKSLSTAIILFFCLCLSSCNNRGDRKNTDLKALAGSGDFRLSGTLTFEEFIAYRDISSGIVEVYLPDLGKKRLTDGRYAWRHPDGEIVLISGCGHRVNRLVLMEESGKKIVVSPCSSDIPNPGASPTTFEFSRLSPDKKLIVAELKYYYNDAYRYSTVVLKDKEIVKVFDNFAAPEWLPDGRLLLASDGLYITEVNGEPKRIDDGTLSGGPNNPDLDPSGKRIAFEWNQRIWTMDINGQNLKELAAGTAIYRFPSWSPDGKYIAFLSVDGYTYSNYARGVHIMEVASGENIFLDLSPVLGGKSGFHIPFGPVSWTK